MVAYNSHPLPSIDALHKLLTAEQIGVEAGLTVIRRGERLNLQITPAESGVSDNSDNR